MDPSLAGTEIHSFGVYAMLTIILLLVSVVGYFLSRMVGKVDKTYDHVLIFSTQFTEHVKTDEKNHQDLFKRVNYLERKMGST